MAPWVTFGELMGAKGGAKEAKTVPATKYTSPRWVQGGCREGAGRVQGGCREGARRVQGGCGSLRGWLG